MSSGATLGGGEDPFAHGGAAGEILRGVDWSKKSIGPVEHWPQSLRTALSICLASRHPICIIWGADRLYLYNDAYAPIVGAKHPWAQGESYITVWPEIWESSIRPILESVERTGEASWCDNLLLALQRRGFNEECYFSFSFAPTRIEDGSVGGVFTAITETTPQVVGERRLRTLRDLGAQAATAKTPEEACRLAAQVFAANPHDVPFALFYVLPAGEKTAILVGQTGLEAGCPACAREIALDSADAHAWPLASALGGTDAVVVSDLATRFGVLSGGPWPEPTHTALLLPIARAGQASPYGFIVAGISPRRPLDDDYRSFLKLATGQVATAISNAQAYAEERRRAEALAEIDQAKTAFFSNVSHEFRTPLTLMLGPLEELLDSPGAVPPLARTQLETTHRNSLRLLKLVNTLLDFSRIEAGRVQARYEPVELGAFTAELAAVFRAAVEKAGLRLIVDCPPISQAVAVDRDMWEKIVFNLLSNAFKFTLEGEIEVRLREIGAEVQLSVRDTGVGIPEAELPNVFKRFYRIANSASRTHEGTGIGLALAQELAKLHGGSIAVTSQPGAGTTFTVVLPAGRTVPAEQVTAPRPDRADESMAAVFVDEAARWLPEPGIGSAPRSLAAGPAPTTDGTTLIPGGRARVLFVDDNGDMRAYVERLLAERFDVITAPDGEAALALVASHQPDLVVTDIMMPRLDGLGLLRALRDNPATRTIPVILLSARAGAEASVDGYDAGADDYLTKPFSARELLARVRTHLRLAELRRSATQAVESERRRLRDLLRNSPAAICVLRGPQHVFEFANPGYVAIVRRTDANQLVGKPVREALPEIAGQGYFEILDRVYTTGTPYLGKEMKVDVQPTPGGELEPRYVDFVYQPTRDIDGQIDGIFVHVIDMTDQVRARHEVERLAGRLEEERDRSRAREQHFRAIVDTTPECVKLVSPNGTLLEMNVSGLAMIEAGPDDVVIGRSIYDLVAPEDRERFRQFNQAVCQGAKAWLEFDIISLRGTRRRMDALAVPLRMDGRIVQLALTRDVTEHKRIEATVDQLTAQNEQQRRLYHAILSSTPDLAYVFDRQHRFTYANDALLQMWGRTWDQASGKTCLELGYEPWHAAMHDREIEQVIATRQPVRGKVPFEGTHGRRTYDYIFVPVLGADGEVEAVAGTTRDVTEMVKAGETLAERRAELERLVDERTVKLKQAVEQMEEFSYSISHDLRSPTRSMCGYAEALLEDYGDQLDADGRELLMRIQRNSGRMDRLIRDLLTYSRISRREIQFEPVSLNRLLGEIILQYPELHGERAEIQIGGPLPDVTAHEPSLTQALSNLLTNAVKFVAPGTRPRVEVWSERRGARVRLWVRDNGIGIAPELHPRLFGMFERVHPEKNYEGTGIGLAIVRKAVERMNGTVGIESDGKSGSRFWIELPATDR